MHDPSVRETQDETRLKPRCHRVMRELFVPKKEGVARDWRRLHNEELHNLYASLNIIKMMKLRRMR
jgi:hypothetical protein